MRIADEFQLRDEQGVFVGEDSDYPGMLTIALRHPDVRPVPPDRGASGVL